MIPAAFAHSLPSNNTLDPFEIFFILDKSEYKKNRGWLNRLNKDKTLTMDLFKIKVFQKELLTVTPEGVYLLKVLKYSNVIAKTLHSEVSRVHVEHQYIDISEGDSGEFRQSLNLFLLQLCRANIDEIREMLCFPHDRPRRRLETFDKKDVLLKTEETFEKIESILRSRISGNEIQRLRPFKLEKTDFSSICFSEEPSTFYSGFLQFNLPSNFSDYTASKEKKDVLESLEIIMNNDGNFVINKENLKTLLIKGGFIVKKPEGGINPWIEPEQLVINVKKSAGRHRADRYPVLEIKIGDLSHDIHMKSIDGSILYIATLLKRQCGLQLRRAEIMDIFNNIPKKGYPPINADNIEEYVADENFPAFEWLREIYSSIFSRSSFNEWFYNRYKTGWDTPFRNGLSHLKKHITGSLYNAGYEVYTPFITLDSKKGKRSKDYTIKIFPQHINFIDYFQSLEGATETYIKELSQLE